jgi:uncharacterized protein YaiI (UPF0178 family)
MIYIGADTCPVKHEIYRGAEQHAGKEIHLKISSASKCRPGKVRR